MGEILRRGTRDKPRFYIRYQDLDAGRKTGRVRVSTRDEARQAPAPFAGSWHIDKMELWDKDAIDFLGPANIKFDGRSVRRVRFHRRPRPMDFTFCTTDGQPLVKFVLRGIR